MLSRRRLLFYLALTVVGVLCLHAGVDAIFFNDRGFWQNLLRPTAHEVFLHTSFLVGVAIVAGIAAVSLRRQERAQRRHQASELRYRTLFEVSPVAIVVHDRDGIAVVNQATLDLFGLEDYEAYRGTSVFDFIHPDYRAPIAERMTRIYRTGEPTPPFDVQLVMLDGTLREVSIASSRMVLDERPMLVTFMRDVTELKETHRDLVISRERLQLALDAAQDGAWDWDLVTGEIVYNDAWARMLGYDPDELTPSIETWESLVHPADRERAKRTLNDHLEGKTATYNSELRLRHGNGQYLWILDRGKVVSRDAEGRPLRMAGTHRNINRRKESELALEIRNRIARIFLTEPGVAVYPAVSQLVCEVTQSRAALIGVIERPGALRFKSACVQQGDELRPIDPPVMTFGMDNLPDFFREVIERREPVSRNESMDIFADHMQLDNAMAVPILSGDDIVGLIVVANQEGGYTLSDAVLLESLAEYMAPILQSHLSDQAKEAQLRQAQKMEALGALAGGIAHDFNNILQAIVGFTTLAREQVDQEGPLASDLSRVMKAAGRGTDLVKSILLFSRREEQERQRIAIEPIVREAVELLRPTIPSTIEIHSNLDAGHAEILADPSQISQIVMNLATNSYHAMEDVSGILSIDLQTIPRNSLDPDVPAKLREMDLVLLRISDTGCGMSAEVMDRLFDPFFTTKEVGKGTGLGLSVVHGIVVAHRGEIRISSEPGCGTVVKVYLPRLESGAERLPEAASGARHGAGPARILVVDDEKDIGDFASAVLSRLGHRVDSYHDSVEALSRLRENPHAYDLLITDLTMPQMTGLQLADEATGLRPDLPVILITGANDRPDWELAPPRIIRAVLHKPFDQESLCRIVDQLLGGTPAAKETG